MNMRYFFAALVSTAIGSASLPPVALGHDAATTVSAAKTTTVSAAKKKRPVVRRKYSAGNGRQIACTPFGCHPIPRNCHPTTGYDWWGNPTGYDAVICR